MSKPIKITTDSTADLSPELIEKYNISITPLHIEMDGKSYSDGVDATPEDLFSYYDRTGKLAKSSAVAMGEYLEFFKKLTEKGYDVIHVNIGSFLSSSYQNACLAAEETEGVYVINSKNLSSGTGHIALLAAELAAKGLSAKEVVEQCEEAVERLDVSFIIETLDYLHAGGRCSGVAKFGANMLKLRPSIIVENNQMVVGKKYRGKILDCYLQYIREQIGDPSDVVLDRIFFTHSRMNPEHVKICLEEIKKIAPFKEVIETNAGCVISCHCGPGCCGVLFFRTHKKQ